MKKSQPPKQSRPTRLVRTKAVFEFIVRYPWGTSAINGYRKAARHFGFHTMEDPCYAGSDAYRTLIHKDANKLRAVAKAIGDANLSCQDDSIFEIEAQLFHAARVTFFAHDWKCWDISADEVALSNLRWKRRILETPNYYRVTIQLARRHR